MNNSFFTLFCLLAVPGVLLAQDQEAILRAMARNAELLQKVVAKFDLNGDGTVDDVEKAKVTERIKRDFASGKIPEEFQGLLDRNGNKKIDPEELAQFRAIITRLQTGGGGGPPQFGAGGFGAGGDFGGPQSESGFPAQIPPELMKKFDKNKNGKLEESEQKALLAAIGPKKSRKEQLLEKLDLNGDGKITQQERDQVAADHKAELAEKKAASKKKSADKEDDKESEKEEEEKKDK